MKSTLRLWLTAVPGTLLVTSALFSYGNGVYPGYVGTGGMVPTNVTRIAPSCGTINCHRTFPGGLSLVVFCVPTARSLAMGQAISVTTSATGGQTLSPWGGFCTEATAGTFSAGTYSWTPTAAMNVITHTLASAPHNRTWSFGYTAPSTPGLVEIYTVVNTVNGNGMPDGADFWGFHGYNSAATQSTPVRLYVNETKVAPFGTSCVGSWGQTPVLGSKTPPTIGNANFAIELHGAAPSAGALLLLGANPAWTPFNLGLIGIPGCTLYVDTVISFATTTTAGDLFRAEGTGTWPLPIPNIQSLSGGQIQVQSAIVDIYNGRPITITMTNALAINF